MPFSASAPCFSPSAAAARKASARALEDELDLQTRGLDVAHGDGAAAGFDAAFHNRQAEAGAAGLAGAGRFRAEEGVEEPVQRGLGHAGAGIGDGDDGLRAAAPTASAREKMEVLRLRFAKPALRSG